MAYFYIDIFIGIGAISTGLMAGVYFAFSVFIMDALNALPEDKAITSMISINKVILRSGFMPVFFGSSLLALILIFVSDNPLQATWLKSAGIIYLVGMLLCTLLFNVPLNERLEQAKQPEQVRQVWCLYVVQWTRWNHVRSLSALLACVCYLIALY
jgi:uncharacterized membrane protein